MTDLDDVKKLVRVKKQELRQRRIEQDKVRQEILQRKREDEQIRLQSILNFHERALELKKRLENIEIKVSEL